MEYSHFVSDTRTGSESVPSERNLIKLKSSVLRAVDKFVDELLNQIYNQKDTWKKWADGTGIKKDNIRI